MMRNRMMGMTFWAVGLCWAGAAVVVGQSEAEIGEGLVRPVKQVEVNAAVSGQLMSLAVREGSVVQAGQLLGELDSRVQEAAVTAAEVGAEAEAEIRHAQLQLEEAKVALEEMLSAYQKKAASDWEVRRARLQVQLAEAAVELARQKQRYARAQLALERARLEQYRLVVPFDGVVVRVDGQVGQTLTPQVKVLTVVDLSSLEAEVYVPLQWYGRLKVGRSYRLEAGAPVGEAVTGRLRFIDPVIDPAARRIRCLFEIDNPQGRLPAGFTVRMPMPQ